MAADPLDVLVRRLCEPRAEARVDGTEVFIQNAGGKEIWRGPGIILVRAVKAGLAVRPVGVLAWYATPKAREHLRLMPRDTKPIRGFRPGTPRLQSSPSAYERPVRPPGKFR